MSSNPYERASIKAGDPKGRVKENLNEVLANLGQFRMKERIWEDIQAALKKSKSRSKKGKGLFGFGGSFLGDLIKKVVGKTNPFLGALISAGASGIAEKTRQDQARATAPLKRVLSKYKGRSEVEGLDDTIKAMQDMQKTQIGSDAFISGLGSFAFPTEAGPGYSEFSPTDKSVTAAAVPELGLESEAIKFSNKELGKVLKDISKDTHIGLNENILSKLSGNLLDPETLQSIGLTDDFIKSDRGQLILGLLKNMGPTVWKEAFGADIQPFYQSQKPKFRNPYRGGY